MIHKSTKWNIFYEYKDSLKYCIREEQGEEEETENRSRPVCCVLDPAALETISENKRSGHLPDLQLRLPHCQLLHPLILDEASVGKCWYSYKPKKEFPFAYSVDKFFTYGQHGRKLWAQKWKVLSIHRYTSYHFGFSKSNAPHPDITCHHNRDDRGQARDLEHF